MKQNKLILFDWGNIIESHLINYTTKNAWDDLFKSLGYKGNKIIFNSLGKYQLSTISTEQQLKEVYSEIKQEFKLNAEFEQFVKNYKLFFDKIDTYDGVKEYEHSLKNRCYIGIFSNLMLLDFDRINKQVELKKYDYVFLSYKLEMRKPNIEIYNYIQKNIKFEPKDILFIDDNYDNVMSAKKIGWNAYQLNGLELKKIKKVCEEFLKN